MSNIKRDYGAVSGYGYPNSEFSFTPRGQVYQATHGGDDSRLPLMNRSFISFAFGKRNGKRVNIEDFNLIATLESTGINKDGYAKFEDHISTYDMLNGQQYWGMHYTPNELEFTLSTDGIDQKLLEDFLYWFRPGEAKELILAEHPNRAILARTAEPPILNLLPFESTVEFKIAGVPQYTSTTLYKGDIKLKLIMDDPHWYAIDNILGKKDGTRYKDEWKNPDGQWVYIFGSKDALKILYEDGIPVGSMIQKSMLLGNGAFANIGDQIESKIWKLDAVQQIQNIENLPGGGACINGTVGNVTYKGIIAGAVIDGTGRGIEELYPNTNGYFYYSGTAPAPTTISFTLTPQIDAAGYISSPYNFKTTPTYNTITIESIHKQELQFTTPNLLTSFNKVIEIFDSYVTSNNDWETVRFTLREEVRHQAVREWAIKVIDMNKNTPIGSMDINTLKSEMAYMLKDSEGIIQPITFTFNSETGEASGLFKYRTIDANNVGDWMTYCTSASHFKERVENTGDMLHSNYIILRDRNVPTDEGYVTEWTSSNPEYSHRISHNLPTPISYLSILYKNMYL